MISHILKQIAKRMEDSKCPIAIKLILRELLRIHRQPGQPFNIELKDIPLRTSFHICAFAGQMSMWGNASKKTRIR